jgi:hypothetical protein
MEPYETPLLNYLASACVHYIYYLKLFTETVIILVGNTFPEVVKIVNSLKI